MDRLLSLKLMALVIMTICWLTWATSPSFADSYTYNNVIQTNISSSSSPYYPAIFIFGDSLIDNGNNNHLFTVAKAMVLPYGRDYAPSAGHPTGRFCNGPLSTDYLGTTIFSF